MSSHRRPRPARAGVEQPDRVVVERERQDCARPAEVRGLHPGVVGDEHFDQGRTTGAPDPHDVPFGTVGQRRVCRGRDELCAIIGLIAIKAARLGDTSALERDRASASVVFRSVCVSDQGGVHRRTWPSSPAVMTPPPGRNAPDPTASRWPLRVRTSRTCFAGASFQRRAVLSALVVSRRLSLG